MRRKKEEYVCPCCALIDKKTKGPKRRKCKKEVEFDPNSILNSMKLTKNDYRDIKKSNKKKKKN